MKIKQKHLYTLLYLNINSSVLMILHYTLKNKDLVENSSLDIFKKTFGTIIFKSVSIWIFQLNTSLKVIFFLITYLYNL